MRTHGTDGTASLEVRQIGEQEALRVWVLGVFKVSVGSSRVIDEGAWRHRKAASLFKLLAISPGHSLHREQISDALWPNLDARAGSNNLRRSLHAARGVLDPQRERGRDTYLASHAHRVVLCPEGNLWVDADAFEELARYARMSRESQAYEAALELYTGELLPGDPYEGWAEGPRRRLRETYLSLLSGLATAREERRDYHSAIEALQKVVAEEPIDEEAHARLMHLYALSGRKAEALWEYELLREELARALGAEPSAPTRALKEEIASGRFPPEAAPPVLAPTKGKEEATPHHLPMPRTSFVDREREIAEVRRILSSTRLLTLTGTGGSGKTRLALQTAVDLARAYPGEAWFAGLADVSAPNLVPKTVAGALGLREEPGRSFAETVADGLGEKRVLLVVDNCEHLLGAVAHLVDHLLGSCPRLTVLATSREPLGVEGEVLLTVPPLPIPEGPTIGSGDLLRNASVRLFVDRARQRLPGFSPAGGSARAMARVCRKLEGIPLAIELAAGHAGTLATQQLSERLEESLDLLSAGPRTAPPRQRTMRATFDWSHGLLSGKEMALFRRLSIFAGGFSLEAAEGVCPDEGGIGRGEVLELLSGLANKSLVVAEVSARTDVRYRMLEPVRQYALEKLQECWEAGKVRDRHAAYFLALAERAEPELKAKGQSEWLGRLEEDHANLRAAMAWLLKKNKIEDAVRMAWALWIFWMIHGHQGEGRRCIEEALSKGEGLDTHARAKALAVQFSTYYGLGTPERMEPIAEEAADLFRKAGDSFGLPYALSCLATVKMYQGDTERAIALFREAIPIGLEAGDKWGPSGALGHLGTIYLSLGDHAEAARCFEEGLALSREIDNRLGEATALYGLAMAARQEGDLDRAAEMYSGGFRSAAVVGDRANAAYSLEGLAQVAVERGQEERAARLFGAAEAALEDSGGVLYAYAQDRSARGRAVESLRSLMGEEAFSVAWAKGRAMSPQEALQYALSGGETGAPVGSVVPGERTPGGRAVLTRREEEVAVLVARGLTNHQIGSELTISEHTAAHHVARILRKLGLGSRAQVAAWVARRRAPR